MVVDDEFKPLSGIAVAWFGFDPNENEWILIFTNGRRLVLSAGDDPSYYLSEGTH